MTNNVTMVQVEAYIHQLAVGGRHRPKTLKGYAQVLCQFAQAGGDLCREKLEAFIRRGINGKQLAPATQNHRLIVLGGLLSHLLQTDYLATDPTEGISLVPQPRSSTYPPSTDELRRVLTATDAAPSPWMAIRDNAIVQLLFNTGLRVAELYSLDIDQVDRPNALLRQAQRKGGKTADVVLNAAALQALDSWLKVRPQVQIPAILLSSRRQRLAIRSIQALLNRLGKRANIGHTLHPHALRHSHATALQDADVPISIISQSLNHSSLEVTGRYLHVNRLVLRNALNKLPQLYRTDSMTCTDTLSE